MLHAVHEDDFSAHLVRDDDYLSSRTITGTVKRTTYNRCSALANSKFQAPNNKQSIVFVF